MTLNKAVADKSFLRSFPKAELHRHLEGTFYSSVLYKIALKNELLWIDSFDTFKSDLQFPDDNEPDFLLFLSKLRNGWYRCYD